MRSKSQLRVIAMDSKFVCRSCLAQRQALTVISRRKVSTATVHSNTNSAGRKRKTSNRPPTTNPNRVPLEHLTPTDISYYWDTTPPNPDQLAYADKFFEPSRHSPIKLWSASKFRTTPLSSEPEVAFLGRSNVGKSSLLNALTGQKICWTSSKPGRTREMNAFGIGGTKGGESKVVLLDMPGYGKGSRTEWGTEILKYLRGRKQ